MTRHSVALERLEVARHGTEQARVALDLAPGVCLIHGPNASGKTTLAQGLAAALWPDAPHAPDLIAQATWRCGPARWSVRWERGHAARWLDDQPTQERPRLPDPSERTRYVLTLPELFVDDGASFAEHVARASAGGFDLNDARRALRWTAPRVRRGALQRDERAARERLLLLRQDHERLQHAQDHTLADLRAQLRATEDAAAEAARVERRIAWMVARAELAAARAELDALPAALDRLSGGEHDLAAQLLAALDAAQRDTQQAAADLSAQADQRDALGPALRLDPGDRAALDAALRQLDACAQAALAQARDLDAARARLDASPAASDPDAPALDPPAAEWLDALDALAQDLTRAHAGRDAAQLRLDALAQRAPDPRRLKDDPDLLRDGVRLLNRWLSAPDPDAAPPPAPAPAAPPPAPAADPAPAPPPAPSFAPALAVALTLWAVGLALALAALAHPAALLLALVPAGLFVAGRRSAPASASDDAPPPQRDPAPAPAPAQPPPAAPAAPLPDRLTHQRAFIRLGLDASPPSWRPEPVRDTLDALVARWRDALLARAHDADVAHARTLLADALSTAERAQRALDAHLRAARLAPQPRPAVAVWAARRLALRLDALAAHAQADAAHQRARAQLTAALDAVNHHLAAAGAPPAASPEDAHRAVATLYERAHRQAQLDAALDHARHALTDAQRRLDAALAQRDALTARIGVDTLDLDQLLRWQALLPARDRARARVETLQAAADHARAQLSAPHPGDPSTDDDDDDLDTLRARLTALADRRHQREALIAQRAQLETQLDAASRSHALADAIAQHAQRLDDLEAARHDAAANAVGDWLIDHLQRLTAERQRPAVFHRARDLFARITRGRYRLALSPQHDAGWTAHDTLLGRTLPLDALSTASRVQLLLAVRVAFIEHTEPDSRVPLVLDEILATSDPLRAEAVLHALTVLAAEGRQILVFTSRRSDVDAWTRALSALPDPPPLHVASLEPLPVLPLDPASVPLPLDPPPAAHLDATSHLDLGRRLALGPFGPRQPIGLLHVWFLTEDLPLLRRLLALRVDRWGPLEQLIDLGAPAAASLPPAHVRLLRALARAAQARAAAWAVGRGLPLDRAALLNSGAVSDTFIDEVAALADRLDGDAAQLIQALYDGQVARFRRHKVDDLSDYCEQHGHLSDQPTLDPNALWARVLAAVADDLHAGVLDPDRLRAFLLRLDRGAADTP